MFRVQRALSGVPISQVCPATEAESKLTQKARQPATPNAPAVTSRHRLNKGPLLNYPSQEFPPHAYTEIFPICVSKYSSPIQGTQDFSYS